ncbi:MULTISPECIES: LysR family transcriptional regulator substrate-binding protein [Brevibacillus]|uniref:LysR family transcriptional regulator substrate-binding protein n=1 Tax=Brevibacillus TaxID=55080 RepID=UPI0037C59738
MKIAAPESITVYRLEPILREYRKKYPQVSIQLSNASCGDNQKALLNGSADVAFVMLPLCSKIPGRTRACLFANDGTVEH